MPEYFTMFAPKFFSPEFGEATATRASSPASYAYV